MSRVDEHGVRHPTEEDPWDVQTQAHIAYCRECSPYADIRLAALLAAAWDEGGTAAIEREHTYGAEEKAKFSNPYRQQQQEPG